MGPARSRAAPTALLLAAGVLALYSIGLTYSPPHLHHDEVFFAVEAQSIAANGRDVYGRVLPLYFQISEDVWFHPALVYVTAMFLKALPVSMASVRFPSVVVGATNVVLIYLIGRRLFRQERWAILAAVLLALTPAHFVHSRIAMDYLYPVPFVLGWLLGLLIYVERRRTWILFAATSCLGVGFYSYIASVAMMPLYVGFTWIALWRRGDEPRRAYAIALAGFLWPLALLGVWVVNHRDALAATASRYELSSLPRLEVSRAGGAEAGGDRSLAGVLQELRRATHFSGLTGRVSLYWYFFDPSYLFVTGGYANIVNSTRRVGVFVLPFAVLVPLGAYVILKHRRRWPWPLLVAGFATAPLAACLVVPEPYAIDREMAVVPFGVLLATAGAEQLLTSNRPRVRLASAALVAIVPLHFLFFLYVYFTDYRVRSAAWFEGNRIGALAEAVAREPREHPTAVYLSTDIPYVDWCWRFCLAEHRRLDLLPHTTYFDPRTTDLRDAPIGAVVVTTRKDVRAESLAASGPLRRLAVVKDADDSPTFLVYQR